MSRSEISGCLTNGATWKADGAIARYYDDLCLRMTDFQRAQRFLADKVLAYCSRLNRQVRVLEIGCGTGITTGLLLAETENIHLCALDHDPVMIAAAQQRVRVYGSKVKFVCKEIVAFCAEEHEPWDIVVSAFTLHNLRSEHQLEILKCIRELVFPGGLFLLADYSVKQGEDRISSFYEHIVELFNVLVPEGQLLALQEWVLHTLEDMRDVRVQDEARLIAMLKEAGFATTVSSFIGPLEAIFECEIPHITGMHFDI